MFSLVVRDRGGGDMAANVGRFDAWIRWILALGFVVVAVAFNGWIALSLASALLALVCGATALTHSCPIYRLFGLDTARRIRSQQPH
jgi:hypothetical protein